MGTISNLLRWSVAAVTLAFGGLCVVMAVQGVVAWGSRLGLTVYMIVQGGMYAAAAAALMSRNWRILGGLLGALGLVQLVYAAEVNPPTTLDGTLRGIVIGGMGPTLLLAAASLAAWAMSSSREGPQVRS